MKLPNACWNLWNSGKHWQIKKGKELYEKKTDNENSIAALLSYCCTGRLRQRRPNRQYPNGCSYNGTDGYFCTDR